MFGNVVCFGDESKDSSLMRECFLVKYFGAWKETSMALVSLRVRVFNSRNLERLETICHEFWKIGSIHSLQVQHVPKSPRTPKLRTFVIWRQFLPSKVGVGRALIKVM